MIYYDYKVLEDLLKAPSPSGQEIEGTKVFDSWMKGSTQFKPFFSDSIGNSVWYLGKGPKKILLSAHVDEICVTISKITEEGDLICIDQGGVDDRTFWGSQLIFLTDDGKQIPAVTVVSPIHVWWHSDDKDSLPEMHKIKVSVGATSVEEVTKMGLHVGSLGVYKRNINTGFGPSKELVYGNALDDKICIWSLMMLASELKAIPGWTIYIASMTQEEVGLRGAGIAAHRVQPDISIDLDTTIETDPDLGISEGEYSPAKVGKGFVLEYGPDKSRRLCKIFKDLAEAEGIPYQEVSGKAGGTNTARIQAMSVNCETHLLTIPVRSLHTPNETAAKSDIEGLTNVLLKYLSQNEF